MTIKIPEGELAVFQSEEFWENGYMLPAVRFYHGEFLLKTGVVTGSGSFTSGYTIFSHSLDSGFILFSGAHKQSKWGKNPFAVDKEGVAQFERPGAGSLDEMNPTLPPDAARIVTALRAALVRSDVLKENSNELRQRLSDALERYGIRFNR